MKDYRRMLYRLDLATSFRSTDALLQHFMSETPLDGFIEIRVHSVYPTSDAPVSVCPIPSARLSFFRESSTGEVFADKLFEPARDVSERNGEALYRQRYTVAQRFPPGTLLSQAFNPLIQPLLKGMPSALHSMFSLTFARLTLDPSMDECEVVNRQAPHKMMVGYVGRSERGALSAYQLDDNVARTTFLDMNPMAFHVNTANNDLGRECVIA
ncbi:hypothetical protein FRC07_009697 [Ceratobasidium sp. 392]|nr:hypothetical protein FRC07_009697 [Ceratobasidium sp. 392]